MNRRYSETGRMPVRELRNQLKAMSNGEISSVRRSIELSLKNEFIGDRVSQGRASRFIEECEKEAARRRRSRVGGDAANEQPTHD